jgi:hypothetical protein
VQRPDEDAGDALRSLAVVFERYTHLKRNIGTLLEDCTEADRPAHNA